MNNKLFKEQKQDDDGFILVESKGKKPSNKTSMTKFQMCQQQQQHPNLVELDKEYVTCLKKKILDLKLKLKDNDMCFFWSKMKISLKKILIEYFQPDTTYTNSAVNLICYGLGSLDDNMCSRYQLALFLLIIDEINEFKFLVEPKKKTLSIDLIELYDPIFNQNDIYLLTELFKFKISNSNEKCLRSVHSTLETKKNVLNIFYMPHCEKTMYNNLLYSNWSKACLSTILIIGNSFSTIDTNSLDKDLKKYYSFIMDSNFHLVNETRLNSFCDLTDAFTDLAFHLFDRNRLEDEIILNKLFNKFTSSFDQLIKPIYENECEEIG
jgi:hypothetical protein